MLLLVAGCSDPNRIYERNIDFPNNLWLADSIAEFEFQITNSAQAYDLHYNVRNSISYPYHNLYVQYTLEDSVGNVLSKALQNMDLFDPVTGKPMGDGLGDIFDHRILAIAKQQFPSEGWYRFRIQQFMRQDSLPLIMSIGLRVEVANEAGHPENAEP
jgi:gliding motility-associated lipoprotein GldH